MRYFFFIAFLTSVLQGHPTYTGYSGAAGSKGSCASSCHGSGTGTISVNGIPVTYIPLTPYTITVKHNGGSTISNFNASSRKGTTAAAAGSFSSGTNSALYAVANYESGVRASVNNIDSSVFYWTAPPAGTGEIKIFLSGLQGSKSGATTKIVVSTTENVTGVATSNNFAESFELEQNFPNPFNPSTIITYQLPITNHVTLKIFDVLGKEIETLVNERQEAGTHQVIFESKNLSGGVYFYSLRMNGLIQTKRMVILK